MNRDSANEMKPLISSNLHAQSEREQSTPKLMFFGDPHGDLAPVVAAVEHFRPRLCEKTSSPGLAKLKSAHPF